MTGTGIFYVNIAITIMSYISIVDINMEGLLYQVKLTSICPVNMSHLQDLNKDKPEGQTVQ